MYEFLYLDDDASMNISMIGKLWEKLIVLRKTSRTSMFLPPSSRSKYICVPKNVIKGGNHIIDEFLEGIEVNVPPSIGFLHHYRSHTPKRAAANPTGRTVVDRTMHKYKDRLLNNIMGVLLDISQHCKLF